MIKEETKVVMTEQKMAPSIDDNLRSGMMFVYRGYSEGAQLHEFAPDFDQGHNVGFMVPQDIFDDHQFRRQFKVVTEWPETE